MITNLKIKAKPSISAQKVADDLIAGNVPDAIPAVPTFELEVKATCDIASVREIVEFVKSKTIPAKTEEKT